MMGDRPLLGIILMLGFCIFAPLGDSIAKLLSDQISLGQLVFVRFAVQTLLLLPFVWYVRSKVWFRGRILVLTIARTVLHIGGIAAMFTSFRFLPLADAIAIAFVMPFLMLILGKLFLGEEVGTRRIVACMVGFVGTLLVIQPSFEVVGAPALLPLLVAVFFAFFMLITRQLAKDVDPISLQVSSGFYAVIIMGAILLLTQGSRVSALEWVVPGQLQMVQLLGIGVLGTCAHLLMTWSLKFAPAATLAPMQYLEIPIATLVGWMVFGDLPNGLAAVGICITVGAGLYVIYREHAISKPAVTA